MQRCPICRARLHGASLCPRCGVDLELAQRAETTARSLEAQALAALLANDPEQAARHLQRAEQLKRHTTQQQISGMIQQSQLAEKTEIHRLEAQALDALLDNDLEQAAQYLQLAAQLKRHPTQQQISGVIQQSQLAEKVETDPAPTATHQTPPIQARRWWI